MASTTQRSILVLSPHPDDETIGCGGTLRMLADGGVGIDVLFLTRGELGDGRGGATPADGATRLAEAQAREAQLACQVLGTRDVSFLAGRDGLLAEQSELAAEISARFAQERYQRVFCPWQRDGHSDHAATFKLLQQAVQDDAAPTSFWLYEVWTPLAANTFVPIDRTIEAKRRAMEQYRTQVGQSNYVEGCVGLSAYRSMFCPPAKFAEAFLVCDRHELLRM